MSALEAVGENYRAHSRQAFLVEPGELVLRDYVAPHPGPGEVLIQIRCALSCGTDLKTFRRGHPMWKMPTPFGHEFSGVVVEVGEGVTAFKVGDAMMAAPTAPCGICFYCQHGQENLCARRWARWCSAPMRTTCCCPPHIVARNTFLKPADLPFEEAALLEPLVVRGACAGNGAAREKRDRR